MAKISTYLKNILSARYGKDVRQSIHDAIVEIDNVADSAQGSATQMAQIATEKAEQASKDAEMIAQSIGDAITSATNAKASEENAKTSETNAKASETNAKVSEQNAQRVFESLPEDYSELSKAFYNTAIKQTATGKTIHVTDSADSKVVAFGLYGKAEQKQYIGKNLLRFPYSYTSRTINGITFTVNDDGTVTANGTATAQADFILKSRTAGIYEFEPGEYILNGCPSGSGVNTYRLMCNKTVNGSGVGTGIDLGGGVKINVTEEETPYSVYISIAADATVNNVVFKPMISKEGGEYEPFVGGMASPNPKFPQNIEVAGASGSIKVVSHGKNWLNNLATSQTVSGVEFAVDNKDKTITLNGTATAGISLVLYNSPLVLPKGNYILSIGYGDKGLSSGYPLLTSTTTYKDGSEQSDHLTSAKGVMVIGDDVQSVRRFRLYMQSGMTFNNLKVYPMLRKAEDSDTYEPHTKTTATISTPDGLLGIPVGSGENHIDSDGQKWVSDVVYKYADGTGCIERNCYEFVLNGSESWFFAGSYTDIFTTTVINTIAPLTIKEMLCDSYVATLAANTNMLDKRIKQGSSGENSLIYIRDSSYSSVAELKSALAEKPIRCIVQRREPVYETLTAEEIAEIEKLNTFYPITNISNDADCDMTVTYLCDSKNYIDNRFAQIEAALYNNI